MVTSYVTKEIENAAIAVAIMDSPEEFSILRYPGVAASFWRRQLPNDFQTWVDNLNVESLPSTRTTVKIEVIRDAVEAICDSAAIPHDLNRHFLVDDVVMLAERFSALMATQILGLRFDVIHDNACRKFHIDAVTARLVCTYRGQGTQYGISTDGAEPKRIFSVPTSSPILLRGTKWPELPASGLLHRSPPIEGTGETRLVLVIDPIIDETS